MKVDLEIPIANIFKKLTEVVCRFVPEFLSSLMRKGENISLTIFTT